MHLPTAFRPRLKPLARLIMLLGGLPLAAMAADQDPAAQVQGAQAAVPVAALAGQASAAAPEVAQPQALAVQVEPQEAAAESPPAQQAAAQEPVQTPVAQAPKEPVAAAAVPEPAKEHDVLQAASAQSVPTQPASTQPASDAASVQVAALGETRGTQAEELRAPEPAATSSPSTVPGEMPAVQVAAADTGVAGASAAQAAAAQPAELPAHAPAAPLQYSLALSMPSTEAPALPAETPAQAGGTPEAAATRDAGKEGGKEVAKDEARDDAKDEEKAAPPVSAQLASGEAEQGKQARTGTVAGAAQSSVDSSIETKVAPVPPAVEQPAPAVPLQASLGLRLPEPAAENETKREAPATDGRAVTALRPSASLALAPVQDMTQGASQRSSQAPGGPAAQDGPPPSEAGAQPREIAQAAQVPDAPMSAPTVPQAGPVASPPSLPEPTANPSSAPEPAVATPVREAAQTEVAQPAQPSVNNAPAQLALPFSAETLYDTPEPARPGERLALKPEQSLDANRPVEQNIPVFVQGLKISGQTGIKTVVEGEAELRKRGSQIKADTITYWPETDEMLAERQVRVLKDGDLFTGSELRLKMDAKTGYFLDVDYLLAGEKARGEARRLDLLGQDAYHAEDGTYTTCGPGNDDWYLKVAKMNLDFGRDLGEAEDATIVFKGRGILELPSMSFPLNDRRKSGFLAPTFGSTIQSGQELSVPYYWNIAPNRDMTITERLMSKRGLQSSAAFRYLGEDYRGQISAELLPNDNITKTTRSGLSILHTQTFFPGFGANINLNKVSDNTYFTDLSARLALTAQTYLPRETSFYYAFGEGHRLDLGTSSYQTLQDPLSPVNVPYFRLPTLNYSYYKFDLGGFDFAWNSNITRFSHATQVMGNRAYINPSVSYPVITPGFYITPKIALSSTRYMLEDVNVWQTGQPLPVNASSNISRSLPIFSVDSGMTFERDAEYFGRQYTQTLEPRVFYLRVPYRDQSNIPIFDTGVSDFNFSQIFSDNRYSGYDRIADANQLTVALSSRLLSTDSGAERLRVSLGQRYYFSSQLVTLPGEAPRVDKASNYLASISGDVVPRVRFDSAVEYDPNQKQIQRISHGIRWSPEPGNTLSASYRYQRDLLEQVDFAAQWRVMPRLYGVGRYNYSLRDGRLAEAVAGFEYDGDCWVGRVVMQRYATATQKYSSAIFFQIELNGLSRLGSNPLELLRRNIPGYSKLNENQTTQPRTFNNYE